MADIVTIARGDGSLIAQPQRVIVRDQSHWTALWAAHAGPSVPAPAVDFGSRLVAAVFAGERPSAGFQITMVGLRRDGPALTVIVEEHRPPPGLVAAQILVSPFHIATIPAYAGDILFENGRAPASPSPPVLVTIDVPARASGASSTGFDPRVAAALAYLAGPVSGALLLVVERTNDFVRFHAWQSLIGLGTVGVFAVACLLLAFLALLVSPTAFWALLWIAAAAAASWLVIWALCLAHAYGGRRWKLPLAGDYAERRSPIRTS